MTRSLCVILCVLTFSTSLARADATLPEKIATNHPNLIPREALDRAFAWFDAHKDQVTNKNYLTIIDFTRPSTEKRCHVINLRTGEVESLLCAHGRNTGLLNAERFSNKSGSNQSSLGIYLTGELYQGKNGLSMKLDGMEPTNSNARRRAIVMHGAKYVSEATIKEQGRLGRSLGCPALEMGLHERIVKQLNGKSVMLIHGKESANPTTQESNEGKRTPGIDE